MPTQAPQTNLSLIMAYITCDSEASGAELSGDNNSFSAEASPSPQLSEASEVSDYKEPGAGVGPTPASDRVGLVSDHKELHPGVCGPDTAPANAASLRVDCGKDNFGFRVDRARDSLGETLRIEATLGLVEPLRLRLVLEGGARNCPAQAGLASRKPGPFGAGQQGADTELSLRPWWDGERTGGQGRGGQGSGFQAGGLTGQHGHGHGVNGVVSVLIDEALGEASGLLGFWAQAPDALAVWVAGVLEEKVHSTVRYSTAGQDRREYYFASLAEVRRQCLAPTSGEGGLLPLTSALMSPGSPASGPGAQWPHQEPEGNKESSGAQGGQEGQSRGATWARRIFPARRFPGSWQVPASAHAAWADDGLAGPQASAAPAQAGTTPAPVSLAGLQSNGGGAQAPGGPKAEPQDCIRESPTPGGDCIGDAAWERHQQMKGQHLLQLQLCFLALTSRLQENELCLAAPRGSARATRRLSDSELATVTDFRRLVLGLVLFLSAERGRVPGRFGVEKLGRLEREVRQILGIMGQKAEGGGLEMPLIARRMLPEASSASAKEGTTNGVATASAKEGTTSGVAPARSPMCDGVTPNPGSRGMSIKSEPGAALASTGISIKSEPGTAFGSTGMSIKSEPGAAFASTGMSIKSGAAGGMKRTLSCSSVVGPQGHNKRTCAYKAA